MLKFSLVFAAIAFAGCASERLYVNVIDNEGNPLNKAYKYDEDINEYVKFLQTGLDNYKK